MAYRCALASLPRHAATGVQVREMASLADLKNRISAVTSIKKITSSLKQVATAKLKSSQKTLFNGRPYYQAVGSALDSKLENAPENLYPAQYKNLIIGFAADKGLCGSVNSAVTKQVKKLTGVEGGEARPGVEISVATIGNKTKSQLNRQLNKQYTITVDNTSRRGPLYSTCVVIVDSLLEFPFDKLTLVHNRFINTLNFDQRIADVCSKQALQEKVEYYDYEFEGDNEEVLSDMYEHYLTGLFFSAFIESNAVEIAKRMTSMDGATKAANDMLDILSLQYNRQRQAKITNELIEITSGAQAVKEMMEE